MPTETQTPIAEAPVAEAPALSKYRQRIKSRYADANPQSDSEWDDLAERYMAEDEERLKIFDENSKVIDDIIAGDKDLARVVSEMITNGTPFRAAIAKFFDADSLTPKEGDEDYEYYQKSRDERVKIGKDFAARAAQRSKNEEEAYTNIDNFCKEKGYDDAEKSALIGFINDFFAGLSECKITPEMLQQFDNARNHDADVQEAAQTAEINGRNENIEARRASSAAQRQADGVPAPAGGSSPAQQASPKKRTIFDEIPERKF